MFRFGYLIMIPPLCLAPLGGLAEGPDSGAIEGSISAPAAPGFRQLLAESGMRFEAPATLEPAAIRRNPLFPYDQALVTADKALEIRYAIRPLERILIDYQDPHSATPDPNHMFPLMFQSLVGLLSAGRHSPSREYPPAQARAKFNADWAAAAVFDVSPEFNADHTQALLVAMHKNGLADAYAILLFDSYEAVKDSIKTYIGALGFLP